MAPTLALVLSTLPLAALAAVTPVKRAADCTITAYAQLSSAVKSCSDLTLSDFSAPPSSTIDLQSLQTGATVTFAGTTVRHLLPSDGGEGMTRVDADDWPCDVDLRNNTRRRLRPHRPRRHGRHSRRRTGKRDRWQRPGILGWPRFQWRPAEVHFPSTPIVPATTPILTAHPQARPLLGNQKRLQHANLRPEHPKLAHALLLHLRRSWTHNGRPRS